MWRFNRAKINMRRVQCAGRLEMTNLRTVDPIYFKY